MNNDVQRETALLRSQEAQGSLGEADRQPLGEQLWRCREAAQRHHGAARERGFRDGARVRDQWTEARRTDRDGLGDGGAPDTALREALARDFGSQDRWR